MAKKRRKKDIEALKRMAKAKMIGQSWKPEDVNHPNEMSLQVCPECLKKSPGPKAAPTVETALFRQERIERHRGVELKVRLCHIFCKNLCGWQLFCKCRQDGVITFPTTYEDYFKV